MYSSRQYRGARHYTRTRASGIWQKDLNGKVTIANLQKSCERGNGKSCYRYANIVRKKGNMSQAKEFYLKACNHGKQGCLELAGLEHSQGKISKAKEAILIHCKKEYRFHSQKNQLSGCNSALMAKLEYNRGRTEKSKNLARNSCSKGNAAGCIIQGEIYYMENNISQASKAWKKACSLTKSKFSTACSLIKFIKGNKQSVSQRLQYHRSECSSRKSKYSCKMVDEFSKAKRIPANRGR